MTNKSKTHQEEYLDIVDENNVPTGEKMGRLELHDRELWHRTVHIFLFKIVDGKLWLLTHLRSKTKDRHPNVWATCFGGHLKAGETVEEAAEGELMDEAGLKLNKNNLIKGSVHKRDYRPNLEFTTVFYYKYDNDISGLKFNDGEVQKVKWMEVADILKSMMDEPGKWAATMEDFNQVLSELENKRVSG